MYAECLEHVLQFVGVHDEVNGVSSVELSQFMRYDLLPYVGLADNSIVQTTIARLLFSEYIDKLRAFVYGSRWEKNSNNDKCSSSSKNKTITNELKNNDMRKNNNSDTRKASLLSSHISTSSKQKTNSSKNSKNAKKEERHVKHALQNKKSTNKRILSHECKEANAKKHKYEQSERESEKNSVVSHERSPEHEQKCQSKIELSIAEVIEYIDCNKVEWGIPDLHHTSKINAGTNNKNKAKAVNSEHTSISSPLLSHSSDLDTTAKYILYICPTRTLRESVLGLPLQTLRAQAVTDCITYYAIDGLEQSNGGRLAPCFQSKAHLIWLGMRWLRSRQAISSYYLLEREKNAMGKVMYSVSCRTFPVYAAPLTEEEKNVSEPKTISSTQRREVQGNSVIVEENGMNINGYHSGDNESRGNGESCVDEWNGAVRQKLCSIQSQRQRCTNPLIHYFTRKRNEPHRRFPPIVLDSNLMKYIIMQSPNRKLILEDAIHAFMVAHHVHHARWENFNKANHLRLRKMIAAIGLRIVSAFVYVRAHCRRQVRLVLPAEDLISFVDRRWLTSDLHDSENNIIKCENNSFNKSNTRVDSNTVNNSYEGNYNKEEKTELVKLERHDVEEEEASVINDYERKQQHTSTLKNNTTLEQDISTDNASYGSNSNNNSNSNSFLSMHIQNKNETDDGNGEKLLHNELTSLTEDGFVEEMVLANEAEDDSDGDENRQNEDNIYEYDNDNDEYDDEEEKEREIKCKKQNESSTVLTTLTQRRAEVATQHFYFVPHLPIDWQVAREAECRPVALHSVYAQLTNCGSEKARHKALGAFMESYLKTRSSAIETYYVLAKNSKSFTLVYAPKSWNDTYMLERDKLFTDAHIATTTKSTTRCNMTSKLESCESKYELENEVKNNEHELGVKHRNSAVTTNADSSNKNHALFDETWTETQDKVNREMPGKEVSWESNESNTSEIHVGADTQKKGVNDYENATASPSSFELQEEQEKINQEREKATCEEEEETSKLKQVNSMPTVELPDKNTNESELRSIRFRPDDPTIPRGTSAYSLNLVLEALEQAPLQALTMQQLGSMVDVTVLTRRLLPYLRSCGRITTTGITPAPGRRRVGLVFLTKEPTLFTSQNDKKGVNATNNTEISYNNINNKEYHEEENYNIVKAEEQAEERTLREETQIVTPAIDENAKLGVLLEAERQKQEGVFKYGTRPLSKVPFQSVESHLVLTSLPATVAGVEPSLQTQRLLSVRTQAKSTADRLMALRNGYGWHSLLRAGRLHMELWRQWYTRNHCSYSININEESNSECRSSPSQYDQKLFDLNAQYVYDNLTLSSFCVVCGFSTSDLAEFVELTSIPVRKKDSNYNNNNNNTIISGSNNRMSVEGNTNSFMLHHKWGTRLCDLPESMFMSCRQRGLQPFMHALNILQTRKLITCMENIDAFTTTPLHDLSFHLSCQVAHNHQTSIYYTLYDTEHTMYNSPGGTAYMLLRYWLPVWSSMDQHGTIPHLSSVIKQESNVSFPRVLALSKILRVRLHHCAVVLYQRAGYTLRLPRPKSTRSTIWGKMMKSTRYKQHHNRHHHRHRDNNRLEEEKRKRKRKRERDWQDGVRVNDDEENEEEDDLDLEEISEEDQEEQMNKYSLFDKHVDSSRAKEHVRRDHRVNITGITVAAALQDVFANTAPTQWLHRMWEVIKLLERNRRVMLSTCVAHTTPHYNILDTIRGSNECHAMLGSSQLSFIRSCTLCNVDSNGFDKYVVSNASRSNIDNYCMGNSGNSTMDVCIPTYVIEACVKLYNHDSYGNMIGLEYISQPILNSSVIHLALLATTMRRLTYQCIPSLPSVGEGITPNDSHTTTYSQSTNDNTRNVNNIQEHKDKDSVVGTSTAKQETPLSREEQLRQCVQNAFSPSPLVNWEKYNATVRKLREQRISYLQNCTFFANNSSSSSSLHRSSSSEHALSSHLSYPKHHMERYHVEVIQLEAAFDLALDTLRMIVLSDTSHYHAETAKRLLLTFPPGVVAKARNYLRTLPSFRKGRQRDRVPDLSLINKPSLLSTSYVHGVHRGCANARVMHTMCNNLQTESKVFSCNSLLSSSWELAHSNTASCCANLLANKSTEWFVPHDDLSLRLQPSIDYGSVTSEHGLTEDVIAALQLPLFAWSSPATRDEAQHELFNFEVKRCRRTQESKRTRSDEKQLENTQANSLTEGNNGIQEQEKGSTNSAKKVKHENAHHSQHNNYAKEQAEQKEENNIISNEKTNTQEEKSFSLMNNYSAVHVHEDDANVAETVRVLYPARSLCGNESIRWLEEIAIDAEPSELELAALQNCLESFRHNDFIGVYTNNTTNRSNDCTFNTEAASEKESCTETTAIEQLLNKQTQSSTRIAYPSIFHHVDGAFHHYVWKYFLVHLYRYLLHVPGITHRALLGVMTSSGLVSERACEAGLAALIDSGLVTRSEMHLGNAPRCASTLSHTSPVQRNNVICTSPFQRKRWREEDDNTVNEHHSHLMGNNLLNHKEGNRNQEAHSMQTRTTL